MEAYLKVTDLYSGASLDVDKLRNELKAAHAILGVALPEAARRETRRQSRRWRFRTCLSMLLPPVMLPSWCIQRMIQSLH